MKPLRRAHLADIHRPNSKRKRKEEKTKIGRQRSHVLDLFPLLFNIIKNYFTRPSKSGAPGARSPPGVDNGQSEIKLTKLEFSRPAAVAAQYQPDEGFTGLVQVKKTRRGKKGGNLDLDL